MGPPQIPKTFMPLAQASTKLEVSINVIGIVTDYMAPVPTRGTDWMCSFNICDDSNDGDGIGLKARWFGAQAQLPTISGSGDVVLLRNVKVKSWSGMDMIISNRSSKWTVIPHASISKAPLPGNGATVTCLQSSGGVAPPPSEVLYARYLHDSRDSSTFTASSELQKAPCPVSKHNANQNPTTASSQPPIVKKDKFSLIKDVGVDTYADLVGQVVKIYHAMSRVELYVTDYTSNNLLFYYANPDEPPSDDERQNAQFPDGDPYGHLVSYKRSQGDKAWPGPYGKQTLCVTLWQPHDEFAVRNLRPGMFIHLRNVHVKYDQTSRMEGKLHTDQRYPSRVDVTILDHQTNERCKEVLRRKRAYQQSQERRNTANTASRKKRKAVAASDEPDDDKENIPENTAKAETITEPVKQDPPPDETKQQRRKRRKREAAAAQLATSKANPEEPPNPSAKLSLNDNIRTQNPSQPSLTLAQILSPREEYTAYTPPSGNTFHLPFSNVKYRTKPVRVVDYFPDKLEQWCMRYKESEMDCLDADDDAAGNRDDTSSKWSSAGSEADNDVESGAENGHAFQTQGVGSMKAWSWKWHWRFALRLEDYPPSPKGEEGRMWVFVTKADAECLLKLDARNMRAGEKGTRLVAQLREKMFLLWGDLEERKSKVREGEGGKEAEEGMGERKGKGEEEGKEEGKEKEGGKEEIGPRGLPFECCLKEYGVRRKGRRREEGEEDDEVDLGWDRRFAMFGTVIS